MNYPKFLNLKASNLDIEKLYGKRSYNGWRLEDGSVELTDLSLNALELDLNYHGSYFMAGLEAFGSFKLSSAFETTNVHQPND